MISENYLIGGGPNRSGGGIMLGDNMGNWQVAQNNTCINVGQYGIAIAGGHNNSIRNNVVMGRAEPWSNVGVYVWGVPQRGSEVSQATVEHNEVSWMNSKNKSNGWWLGSNVVNTTIRANNFEARYTVPEKAANIGAP